MARPDNRYVCQSCGAVQPKWAGRCEACGAWNTLAEEAAAAPVPKGLRGRRGAAARARGLAGATAGRRASRPRIDELDRVLGGGMVAGSAVLIGGDPGIGKSTLVLQAARGARRGRRRGRLRQRRGVDRSDPPARRPARARAGAACSSPPRPRCATSSRPSTSCGRRELLVIDSIQTMFVDSVESAPGTVTQLRTSAHELIRFAKRRGTALFLVGHVTKDGQIAGPRVLEHMVDAVLYFEGERGHQFRILRAVKNRFGATNEIGVFEMAERGLVEVAEPLGAVPRRARGRASRAPRCSPASRARARCWSRSRRWSGRARSARRGAPWSAGTARASPCCWRCWRPAAALPSARRDVYLNVAGGLRIGEPAADLAVAAALVSSLLDRPVPATRWFRRGRARRRGARGEPGRGALAGGGEAGLRPCDPAGRRRRAGALAPRSA